MKKIISTLILAGFASFTYASTEAEDKQQVLKVIKQYSEAVSCISSLDPKSGSIRPTTIRDIHTTERSEFASVYYVLWSGDPGCTTVAAAMSSFVSKVAKYGKSIPFTVQDDYAFGRDVGINYKYIQSLKKINSTTFEVVSWDNADSKYGGVDAGSNFPANKFRYTLEQGESGPWKITNQVLIEQLN